MKQHTITTIGRPLDFSFITNKIIAILTILIFFTVLIFTLSHETPLLQSILHAFVISIGVFFTWALARELDPDHDYSAFLGIIFLFITFTWTTNFSFLFIIWMLFTLRIITRTTGKPAGILDIIFYLGITLVLSLLYYPIISILCSITFFTDFIFSNDDKTRIIASLTSFFIFPFSLLRGQGTITNHFPLSTYQIVFTVLSVLFTLLLIYTSKRIFTICDTGEKPIQAKRVQGGQTITLLTAFLFILLYGSKGFILCYIILSSILGVSLYRTGSLIKKHIL